jgi:hypothetical protein
MSDRVTQDEFRAYMTSAGVGYRLAMRHFADRAPPLGTARRWGTTKPKGSASKGDAPYQSGHNPRKKPPPVPPDPRGEQSTHNPRPPNKPPIDTDLGWSSMARGLYLQTSLENAEAVHVAALDKGSFVAAVQAKKLALSVRADLDELRRVEAAAKGADPSGWPRERWLSERVAPDAQSAEDDELEVYVREWMTRHGLVMEPGEDAPRLVLAS